MHPSLFHIGHLVLPTYGLLVAAGLIAALSLSLRTSPYVGVSPDALWNAGIVTITSAFLLSRLLLVVFNLHSFLAYPVLLLTVPSLTPIGILLTALVTLVYLRLKHILLRSALDAWAPCATLLWAFLALGHLAEGSDPGLPTASPLSLPIPPGSTRLHPVSVYATLSALIITAFLLRTLQRASNPAASPTPSTPSTPAPSGATAALGLLLTGAAQFLLTFLRQPVPATTHLGALLDPIQWVALGLIAAGTLLYLTPGLSPRKPPPHAL